MKTTDRQRRYMKAYRKKIRAEDKKRLPWWKDRDRRRQVMETYDRAMGGREAEDE